MSPTFSVTASFLQDSPSLASAACAVPANVTPKARNMAMAIAIDENFFFIDSPFCSLAINAEQWAI
jgi:hypothetical protein